MSDVNKTLSQLRLFTYGAVVLLGLLGMIMSAVILAYTTSTFAGGYFIFTALGVATGVLTIVSLPIMFWLSRNRKGAFTSMVVVEVVWTWVLWVLWLSTGALIASGTLINNCSRWTRSLREVCRESQALAAFSFLNWIILMSYFFILLVLAIRAQPNNSGIWTADITEANFNTSTNQPAIPPVTESKLDAINYQHSGLTNPSPVTPVYPYPQQPGIATPISQSVTPVQQPHPSYPQV